MVATHPNPEQQFQCLKPFKISQMVTFKRNQVATLERNMWPLWRKKRWPLLEYPPFFDVKVPEDRIRWLAGEDS